MLPLAPPQSARQPMLFAHRLAAHGHRPALLTDDSVVTYTDLAGMVDETAQRLGNRRRLVLLPARNDVATVVGYLGALAGGHPVLLAPDEPDRLDALTAVYDPEIVLRTGTSIPPPIEERRAEPSHDLHPDLALLLPTSGSTGSPKLVRLSYDNLQANAASIADYLQIRPDDRAATMLPLHYSYGLSVLNSHLLAGAGLVLTGLSVVDACFWDLFRTRRGTSFAGVPYTFELLDRIGFARMRLPHLRYVTQAGGRLSPEAVQRYARLGRRNGWAFFVMYGQTEATARMAYLPPELAEQHPHTIGIPIPGGSFTLRPVPDMADPDVGELVYSGPNVMLGYAETAADLSLGRTVDVLHTGDLARCTPDGLYEIVGRRNRFAKIFGLRIDLQGVEADLAARGISAVCLHRNDGLLVAAETPVDADRLRQMVGEICGLPIHVIETGHIETIPRLPSGKPDLPAVERHLAARSAVAPPKNRPGPAAIESVADLRRVYAELLGRPAVTDEDTFVSLGGDSLSYVEMSVRLEEALGHLPPDWHITPIRDLVPRQRRRRREVRFVETGVALRAVAIVFIVATHAKMFSVLGSAHVLMALAGFNFARFQLAEDSRQDRVTRQLRSIARIAFPSTAWIAAMLVLTDDYGLANAFLLNALVGPPTWTSQWHFWFIEVLVYTLVAMAALTAVPWVDRAERRWPFALPLVVLAAGLATRFGLIDFGVPHTKPVLWLFALGWAAARSTQPWHRALVTAVAVVSVPGFFGDPWRDALIVVGILLLTWTTTIPVPAPLARVMSVLASASLYIYLTHWQLYPLFSEPLAGVVLSLSAGVLYWWVWRVLFAYHSILVR